jgi:excinuclease UvrABC ATPase subunit
MTRVEMSFLPDMKTLCESCGGVRFNPETLAVKYRDKSIGDVLAMSVDEAVEYFQHHVNIHHALQLLQNVGLGYLTLGQQSPTLYVFNEPTFGLHMADVEKLNRVLHRLVDAGHSAVIIEHNLDVIAEADWCIDMGPESGDAGGEVMVAGDAQAVGQGVEALGDRKGIAAIPRYLGEARNLKRLPYKVVRANYFNVIVLTNPSKIMKKFVKGQTLMKTKIYNDCLDSQNSRYI